ncbi:MAG: Nitrogen permease regulator 3 [Claussenomyces sp. TS43310]|nr:MAG: Nitrogen permease regulator 3 [Claussenomyces sp. TS43310]
MSYPDTRQVKDTPSRALLDALAATMSAKTGDRPRRSVLRSSAAGKDGSVQALACDRKKWLKIMSSDLLPGNSGLLGVALVIKSKEGPRFVFHYPPRLANPDRELPRWGTELDPTTPEASDDEDANEEDDLEDVDSSLQRNFERLKLPKKKKHHHVSQWDGDEHFDSEDGIQIVPWEHLDAFSTKDLAFILTPSRAYHKRCFELSLDPVYYVTYPTHIREDGQWKKPRKVKTRRKNRNGKGGSGKDSDSDSAMERPSGTGEQVETVSQEDDGAKIATSSSFVSDESNDLAGMTMFNLVFIMNPTRFEASLRIKDMFEHVARDLNRALRFAQHYNNYVWKESDLIWGLKEKAREERLPMSSLWKCILDKSSLAVAIKHIFESISSNKIATVRFESDPPVRLSVQIPKPYFLTTPPEDDEEAMPGLWITTADCMSDKDGDDDTVLSKHFALLLLEDESKIIADIQADGGELANPLLDYLKILKPTLSFQQTAQTHQISLADIRILAQHLIYYRRAMAIPPLHGRDTYVVSPNSDNHKLATARIAWRKAFPLAPPLCTFLANLSASPRPFKSFAPSKSHRPVYLEMLAWLMRGGWVTQLRTFARIIVWPELRYEVQYALDAERIHAVYEEAIQDSVDEARAAAAATSTGPLSTEEAAEKARVHRLRDKAKQDASDFARRPKPVATAVPSLNAAPHVARMLPTLIRDPGKLDHVDSLYLAATARRFLPDEHAHRMFMKFAKYLNGREALEKIALNEGLKRREVWALLTQFEEFLLTTRRW